MYVIACVFVCMYWVPMGVCVCVFDWACGGVYVYKYFGQVFVHIDILTNDASDLILTTVSGGFSTSGVVGDRVRAD